MPRVNPDILRWARETAGMSPAEAVRKIDLRDARGASAVERLSALESGEDTPTRPLLTRMSKQYRRPLLTFYLSRPPRAGDRGEDFRTLPEEHSAAGDALLDVLLREAKARQGLVRAAMEDEEEARPLEFIGSATRDQGVASVLASMRSVLGMGLEEYRGAPDSTAAFDVIRSHAEEIGVLVVLAGDLGSWHTSMSVEVFRGVALADPIAPFVIINPNDARSAWSFSLVHELTHLWLGETGVSGGPPTNPIERFCNAVASEYLLPEDELQALELPIPFDVARTARAVTAFAHPRNVSSSMVAYRLYRERAITHDQWAELRARFRDAWLESRDRQRARGRESPGGPDWYTVRQHRLGGLVPQTARLLASGVLSTKKAAFVLGVRPQQVQQVIDASRSVGR